jgi:EAL domain-containing protein (putative c-di-GMP-specific phosphodiesterase class I)
MARIGGDEFLILSEFLSSSIEEATRLLEETVEKILYVLQESLDLGRGIHSLAQPSIGIVICGENQSELDEVLKYADLAMYAAKKKSHKKYTFFDQALKVEFDRSNGLQISLKDAVSLDQFFIEYQPIVNRNQECVAYEALARWRHPVYGTVMPNDFIPFSENSGQIHEVGSAILKSIFSNPDLISALRGQSRTKLMINISGHQLMNVAFADQFLALCDQHQTPLHQIYIELTEGVFISNTHEAIAVMDRLQAKGIKFVLDDFGTGYSSLGYLQKLPVKYLKIDRSFIVGMMASKDDQVIVKNILNLSKSLGLKVVAEGIEDKSQFDFLFGKGCDLFQGWYFGRPSERLSYHP